MPINLKYSEAVRSQIRGYFNEGYTDKDIHRFTTVSERSIRRYRLHMKLFGQIEKPSIRNGRPRCLTSYMEDVRSYCKIQLLVI